MPVPRAIACRVLEVHTSREPHVTVAVFHQQDEKERARLGTLLRQHSGQSIEFQTPDGSWQTATVLRLKGCFGRGLLVLSADVTLAERDTLLLKFHTK